MPTVAERRFYLDVLEEPGAERQLRLLARNSCAVKLRIGGVIEVIRAAAPIDTDINALWNRIQAEFHANQRTIVQSLSDKGALRSELGIDRATDILWTLNHPDVWQLLVVERGWAPDQYEEWFAQTSCAQPLRRQ
jgi:hypothetical protein